MKEYLILAKERENGVVERSERVSEEYIYDWVEIFLNQGYIVEII